MRVIDDSPPGKVFQLSLQHRVHLPVAIDSPLFVLDRGGWANRGALPVTGKGFEARPEAVKKAFLPVESKRSLLPQHKLHDQSRESADDQRQSFADEEALDVKPVVVIVADHIFRALEYKMRIMAEPEDIQHDRVPEVHDGPQQEARPEGPEKRHAAVHIAQDQAEDDDEQHGGGQLGRQLILLRGDLILVLVQ